MGARYFLTAIACLLFGVPVLFGQDSAFKSERMTYLWDVTLSMKGKTFIGNKETYNKELDIYDKVLNDLIMDIQAIEDESTEIVVIPFQTDVCEVFRSYATQEGKALIVTKLKAYNNDKVTNTDIAKPLKHVICNVFTDDRIDYLTLLTDGTMQNMQPLYDLLSNDWDKERNSDDYCFYVMLTDKALDTGLVDVLEKNGGIDVVTPDENRFPAFICPASAVRINVRDEYDASAFKTSFKVKRENKIPEGYQLRFVSRNNPYLKVYAEMPFASELAVPVQYMMSLHELSNTLPTAAMEEVIVDIEPLHKDSSVRWIASSFVLRLVNKPEKSMKFYVK